MDTPLIVIMREDEKAMMKKRKIVYLCLQVTREGQASHAHVHEIIEGLRESGYVVELVEPKYGKEGKLGIGRKLFEFARTQHRCISRMRYSNVVYIRGHFAALPVSLAAKAMGVPQIVEINGPLEDLYIAYPFSRRLSFILDSVTIWQYKLSDAIIAVTPQLTDWASKVARTRIVATVPNGVNTELFRPIHSAIEAVPEKYVVFFGALARWQGISKLLEATRNKDWPKEVKLYIAGDGVERDAVIAEEKRGIVKYLGKVPYSQIPLVIANSLAGVVPKTNDGNRKKTGLSPLKVYETLACGVPAIVTDYPGMADLIKENRCGIVLKDEEPASMARAVSYLHENEEERAELGKRARKAMMNGHSWKQRAIETARIIGKIIK